MLDAATGAQIGPADPIDDGAGTLAVRGRTAYLAIEPTSASSVVRVQAIDFCRDCPVTFTTASGTSYVTVAGSHGRRTEVRVTPGHETVHAVRTSFPSPPSFQYPCPMPAAVSRPRPLLYAIAAFLLILLLTVSLAGSYLVTHPNVGRFAFTNIRPGGDNSRTVTTGTGFFTLVQTPEGVRNINATGLHFNVSSCQASASWPDWKSAAG